MKNYKIIITYDGTNFSGWQIQKNSASIQQKITEAIEVILKEKISLIGSGRTDSGVHALGQTANFKTVNEINIYRFKHSLNSILPPEILISQVEEVGLDFHARYDAKKRTYLYLISQTRSPFYKNYLYFYPRKIDLQKLNMLCEFFLGEKDFTSFSKKNDEIENKTCKIYKAYWYKKGELIFFVIQANRFLHGMVRTIIGTLLNAQDQSDPATFINEIFKSHSRKEAFEAVPAKGLFLYKVEY